MANFAQPVHNPIDDPTSEELIQHLAELGENRDDLEMMTHWQLIDTLRDWSVY